MLGRQTRAVCELFHICGGCFPVPLLRATTGRAIILRGGSNLRRFGGASPIVGMASAGSIAACKRPLIAAARLFVTNFTEPMQEIEHFGFATVDVSGR
jgi:hypothetical protein